MYCSSCSRDTVKDHVRRYLAESIHCQPHVSDFVVRQFSDAFLDECVDSVAVYDLSGSLQVHNIIVVIDCYRNTARSHIGRKLILPQNKC